MRNLLAIIFAVTAFLGCAQEESFDEMIENTVSKTVDLVYADEVEAEDALFLDTRMEEEFEVSHIKGARFVDYDSFKIKQLKDIPKDQRIVVYCSVGYRSEKVGEKLINAGYTNVQNLYGGIFAWKNIDKEVVDMEDQPTEKVHTYNKKWGQWLEKGEKVH